MNAPSPSNPDPGLHVELDRHFHEFTKEELADPEILSAYNEEYRWNGSLSWDDLLKRRRVVILASAGSGKTEELQERERQLTAEQKFAFYVRLEELAQEALTTLLMPEELRRFEEWRATPSAQAWFLLDAVDELKLAQRSLESALRRLRQALDQDLHRVHIAVSSRPTDWRPKADEAILRRILPVPTMIEEAEPSSEAIFLAALSRKGSNDDQKKKTSVKAQDVDVPTVLLLPLADRHIREFARQRGVSRTDEFFEEIAKSNSWLFARRPLDLIDLISNWNSTGRLGTKQEQHRFNIASKLKDMPNRPDAGVLSDVQAEDGAERLALAMALTRNRAINAPDSPIASGAEHVLDASEILRDWSREQRSALLRRGLFDPATFGRVRFHHRSVQEFLAALRLLKLKQAGMAVRAVFRLLFAEKYGERVVIPSMRPITAWLALWDEDVFRELVARAPEALIEQGDPASLSIPKREAIIKGFVCRHRLGGWRGFRFPMEQINRIASPELAGVIKHCWKSEPENAEVRELLVELIWKGPVPGCANIANNVARKVEASVYHQADAINALAACASTMQLKRIA